MAARLSSLCLLVALLATSASAKDKKKSSLPDYVLKASTVLVVIEPDAGEPIDQPSANATARENVEKALFEWGRLHPVLDGQESDLVIAVRTGSKMGQPTIKGGPIDNRPGVAQSTDGGIRVGGQQGRPPSGPQNNPQTGPRIGKEAGSPNDTFEVYRGGVRSPLESPPVWRYSAKDCLRAPQVSAVEEFRKAITEAEQAQVSKKP